ncbi:hypothetical protein ACSBOB_01130 [Mesorhizobium sp. ASY16-5R]|uniref:hypothetical protein n=1 Tax=Mesorhizobium sp. ASY16-5R TaxID=3445772 RepID=UPI003FA15F0E
MILISPFGTALRPAILLAAGLLAALLSPTQASATETRDNRTYKMLLAGEDAIAIALRNHRKAGLAGVANRLGRIVDEASARKKRGIKASDCDLAAMALANLSLLAEKSLETRSDLKSAFQESAKTEVSQFAADMRGCEKHLGLPSTRREPLKKLLGKI